MSIIRIIKTIKTGQEYFMTYFMMVKIVPIFSISHTTPLNIAFAMLVTILIILITKQIAPSKTPSYEHLLSKSAVISLISSFTVVIILSINDIAVLYKIFPISLTLSVTLFITSV